MLSRVAVGLRPSVRDVVGQRVAGKIQSELHLPVSAVSIVKIFTIDGLDPSAVEAVIAAGVLHDPVVQTASAAPITPAVPADWVIEVSFRPGVTDNEARTAKEAIALALGLDEAGRKGLAVYTGVQYHIAGLADQAAAEHVALDLLANDLLQRHDVKSAAQWTAEPGFPARTAKVTGKADSTVEVPDLFNMTEEQMLTLGRERTLALSLDEWWAIRAYFGLPGFKVRRVSWGLIHNPTDVELECLAQTWSEHCKHKIFSADITYVDNETGRTEVISSLYKSYIQRSTADIRAALGENDFCLSVFSDNAGVVKFTENLNLCIKVETHNSPSALDPYGGALTGIVGVNRDPMGTGIGANLLCNTDVFCFASPFHEGTLPPRLLHPRRVLEGVREGVEHGGNKSGVPTVNGSIVFDERFLGKPLVFCGTVGMLPATINGKPSHVKKALPGDYIVMVGGRIGKDGIHGATFSSEELHEGSPATAVQIGDPITQRRMYDCLMRARDMGLYNAITDNGAGGLSSSVGEMAQDAGGCELYLDRAPLKYDGLVPWEIFTSEAQERMTLAVPPDKFADFMRLAKEMGVEATELGNFTNSGYLRVYYGQRTVAYIDMDFLHGGTPRMALRAEWTRPVIARTEPKLPAEGHGALLKRMLGRLNICSKEYVVRQYDHEVKGGSAVKPMVGVRRDGPSDAGVLRPVLSRPEGVALSHGICPRYSDIDAYWMMAAAIDEAVRGAVAVGADPDRLAGVDNFCWCDPVESEKTPDGRYKLAQLVRANKALAHFCRAFMTPCVSGKDSMKNDYSGGGAKISIPPTVLFSVMGFVPDVSRVVTSDFKNAGDLVYVLGATHAELGASELAGELGFTSPDVPQVEAVSARRRYKTLHDAMMTGLVSACHDCSDGGLAVALAEMAIGGRLGADLDCDAAPGARGLTDLELLYSESASRLVVTVASENQAAFETLFAGQPCGLLGSVTQAPELTLRRGKAVLCAEPAEELARAFKATLDW
ncbi:AIR synthase-related protein [Solidesulfovibrio magneticus]|uniref:Phosphoribosylformylglycinamidine synthase subunit PurL n=1 Tax=Solidesulfovibrio magneticus (strain ATCC 700980 / DSM 13731 / RS-1) TaxID=573370 RepID=C4XLD5_SOLM1|nr:AIR synthase-related protein [Solidesulfovibrio magneticus]BAH77074.1 phosphoribosylformylglycinamidine synthase [Solidesulfovibrio magneticus RS-1]